MLQIANTDTSKYHINKLFIDDHIVNALDPLIFQQIYSIIYIIFIAELRDNNNHK